MIEEDSPPSSPDMEAGMEDDDMIYIGDVDEVIDDLESDVPEEQMNKVVPEKGDAVCVFDGHEMGSVFCGVLSKDGKLAATGGGEDMAYVWDTTTGEIVLQCTAHKDSVVFCEFNFDESYLATGDMSGVIQIWKMSNKRCVWYHNIGDASWMKWHMATNVLIVGSAEGEVYMWKIPDGNCKVFSGYGCKTDVGIILPDGKRIAVGYEDGTIRVIDLKTTAVLSSILPNVGHTSTLTAIDCHFDNNLILSAATDGTTILSTSQNGKIVSVLQNFCFGIEGNLSTVKAVGSQCTADWVESVAFCKDPALPIAATGTIYGVIYIWDIPKQVLRHKIKQEAGLSKLFWKGTTSFLFSAGLDSILRCFDARTSQCVRTFCGHTAELLDLHISENGEKALTSSDDTTARIFDISSLP